MSASDASRPARSSFARVTGGVASSAVGVGIEAHLERFEAQHRVDRLRDESVMVVVPQARPEPSRARRGRRGPTDISGSDGPSLPPVNAFRIICDDEIVHVTAYSYQSCQGTSSKNAAPVMDAAFCISIKTRPNRAERQSPDQHAANSEASWFFCSVIGEYLSRRGCVVRESYSAVGLPQQVLSFNNRSCGSVTRCQGMHNEPPPPPRDSTLHLRVH
jgi:hypothetical protein